MQRLRRLSNHSGFTIIETLIVLAIAGIILMIVFEAIPALERSGRNNQRKQDVQTILEAVSHYELNNSGNIPDCGYSGAAQGASCVGNPAQEPPNNPLGNVNLTYYAANEITVTATNIYDQKNSNGTTSTYSASPLSNGDIDQVAVYNHAKCDASNDGSATPVGASYSDVVALYAVENGSALAPQCQQL